jgi:hypothetical protein
MEVIEIMKREERMEKGSETWGKISSHVFRVVDVRLEV